MKSLAKEKITVDKIVAEAAEMTSKANAMAEGEQKVQAQGLAQRKSEDANTLATELAKKMERVKAIIDEESFKEMDCEIHELQEIYTRDYSDSISLALERMNSDDSVSEEELRLLLQTLVVERDLPEEVCQKKRFKLGCAHLLKESSTLRRSLA